MATAPKDINDQLKGMTISSSEVTTTGEPIVGREIGRGAYGRVFTVKYCGLICAAKEIHSLLVEGVGQQQQQSVREGFLRECQHCSVLNHPNIVRFMGIYYEKSSTIPVMVMEFMDGSLYDYMKYLPKNAWMKKGSILIDVAEGLSYLHAQKPAVVHRDLSPKNILLKAGVPVAKIGDLGVAKIIKADNKATQSVLTKVPGTADFMPPETFSNRPTYGVPLDAFSYGGIMLFMATHQWPTPTAQVEFDPVTKKLTARTEVERRQKYLDEMTGCAEWLKPLVESCLSNDPSERPTMPVVSKQLTESPPLGPALHSGCYELTWEKCTPLPSPMCYASAVLHNEKVHVMAGHGPDFDILPCVFTYDISSNHWDRLPPPGHACGVLKIIDGKLSVIGGWDTNTDDVTNKVSTLINNSWTQHYPNMSKPRARPGVSTYSDYVIVAGGGRDANTNTINDDIELLYYKQSPHWITTNINLPEPMGGISLTISDDLLFIAGYGTSDEWSTNAYKISVNTITSSVTQSATSSQTVQWTTIPSTPHWFTAIIPNSSPPLIVGGDDEQDVPIADVAILKRQSWSKVASLSSPRTCVAVVPIDYKSFFVIGGSTGGTTAEEVGANCVTTVEKGTVRQSHTGAATQDTQCIIQ